MNLNKLLLNPSKTEFLLIGTKQQRLKFSDLTNLSLSSDIIPVSSSARNVLASSLTLTYLSLIRSTLSKSCLTFSHPRHLSNSSSSLSAATAFADSLVSRKFDYCNSLYSGISQANLKSVLGPRLWNSLPPDTRNSNSSSIFRSRLKTHLFKIAFPP